jgi:hypothetical protein
MTKIRRPVIVNTNFEIQDVTGLKLLRLMGESPSDMLELGTMLCEFLNADGSILRDASPAKVVLSKVGGPEEPAGAGGVEGDTAPAPEPVVPVEAKRRGRPKKKPKY